MRSDRSVASRLGALALVLAAGCAPKDAPVCAPAFSLVVPAYGCGAAAAAPPPVVEAPPPVIEAPPPVVAPTLATLGAASIDLAERIEFEGSSATISPASRPLLEQVATLLSEHPEITKVQIEGHTDSQGSNAANLKLSQARADAVRSHLANYGIAADRMVAKGFGETRPLFPNTTEEGRAQNRRVVINILARAP
jgi:outer membrane protein OmpA-like peptidoglycan-associated protein